MLCSLLLSSLLRRANADADAVAIAIANANDAPTTNDAAESSIGFLIDQ